jgi:hypothetical protein
MPSRQNYHTKPDQMRPCQPVGDPSICEKISFLSQDNVAYFVAYPAYLDVISKVVPKIWARTNSAMLRDCCLDCERVQFLDKGERILGRKRTALCKEVPLVVQDGWEIA